MICKQCVVGRDCVCTFIADADSCGVDNVGVFIVE